MKMERIALVLGAGLLLTPMGAAAQSKLNAGPYGNTKFEFTYKGAETINTPNGELTLTRDNINTINCNGCDRREFYPGYLFNIRNNSRKPMCVAFDFTLKAGSYNGVNSWGNGEIFLVKPRQTLSRFAGITMDFGYRRVNLGYDGTIRGWAPLDKKRCGPNPYKR